MILSYHALGTPAWNSQNIPNLHCPYKNSKKWTVTNSPPG